MHSCRLFAVITTCTLLILRQCTLALIPEDDKEVEGPFTPSPPPREAPKASQKFASLIPPSYNALVPPTTESGGPIRIEFSFLIMSMRGIKETDQEINLEMNLRAVWTDRRLQNLTGGKEFLVLHPSSVSNHLWIPDVFIDHAKGIRQHVLMSKPTSFRLHKNGSVRYSARVTATVSCPMNFRYYPADTQKCTVELKSYAYPSDMLMLGWQRDAGVILSKTVSLANFYLTMDTPEEFVLDTSSGYYSGIRFHVKLERMMSYHLLQTYLPSTMFIIVSWLTFILPQDSGAVMICMTTLLTLTASFAAVRQSTPTVSYTKAIDIWMAVCMFYVFLSLIQHTITMRLRHMKFGKKPKREEQRSLMYSEIKEEPSPGDTDSFALTMQLKSMTGDGQGIHDDLPVVEGRKIARRRATLTRNSIQIEDKAEIEIVTGYKLLGNRIRLLFAMITPATFVLFNIVYWSWLLNAAH